MRPQNRSLKDLLSLSFLMLTMRPFQFGLYLEYLWIWKKKKNILQYVCLYMNLNVKHNKFRLYTVFFYHICIAAEHRQRIPNESKNIHSHHSYFFPEKLTAIQLISYLAGSPVSRSMRNTSFSVNSVYVYSGNIGRLRTFYFTLNCIILRIAWT